MCYPLEHRESARNRSHNIAQSGEKLLFLLAQSGDHQLKVARPCQTRSLVSEYTPRLQEFSLTDKVSTPCEKKTLSSFYLFQKKQ